MEVNSLNQWRRPGLASCWGPFWCWLGFQNKSQKIRNNSRDETSESDKGGFFSTTNKSCVALTPPVVLPPAPVPCPFTSNN